MKKTKSKVLALSAAAVLALGIGVPVTALQANAYTKEELPTTVRTPDSLAPMTRQGYREDWGNPNFEDGNALPRTNYGGPWSFAHIDEIGGTIDEWSSYQVVSVDDAVEGMGKMAGKGELIETALEITINTSGKATLYESLTYSSIDDMLWGEVATTDAYYFTAWIKAEQDMWFEAAISYGAKADHAQVIWDLGRRFFVPAGEWTQIGLDADGNYLPFRAKVTDDEWGRGTGSDPSYASSNCSELDTYADESKGDTQIGEYYRAGFGDVWACLRLYAYGAEIYNETNGVGAPWGTNGLEAGDKYLVTGTNFWNQSAPEPVITKAVETVTLDKTTAKMKAGETLQLTATAAPAEADDTSIYWYSSDESIATVDQTGKVTALKNGKVTITAEANDGNGAEASCTITIGGGSGCNGTILGVGSVGIAAAVALGSVMTIRRKKD